MGKALQTTFVWQLRIKYISCVVLKIKWKREYPILIPQGGGEYGLGTKGSPEDRLYGLGRH